MLSVSYLRILIFISAVWLTVRVICWLKSKRICLWREVQLLLVYICLAVVVRYTFCPFFAVNGQIQPLVFDPDRVFPLWINLVPFVNLFDYPNLLVTLLNVIGNVAMFVPLGIVWPWAFPQLNTPGKAIAAGVGVSLTIEILQLPFFDRATDIDDLLLNSLGFILGYLILRLFRKIHRREVISK